MNITFQRLYSENWILILCLLGCLLFVFFWNLRSERLEFLFDSKIHFVIFFQCPWKKNSTTLLCGEKKVFMFANFHCLIITSHRVFFSYSRGAQLRVHLCSSIFFFFLADTEDDDTEKTTTSRWMKCWILSQEWRSVSLFLCLGTLVFVSSKLCIKLQEVSQTESLSLLRHLVPRKPFVVLA